MSVNSLSYVVRCAKSYTKSCKHEPKMVQNMLKMLQNDTKMVQNGTKMNQVGTTWGHVGRSLAILWRSLAILQRSWAILAPRSSQDGLRQRTWSSKTEATELKAGAKMGGGGPWGGVGEGLKPLPKIFVLCFLNFRQQPLDAVPVGGFSSACLNTDQNIYR